MPFGYKWLRDNLKLTTLPPKTAVFWVNEEVILDHLSQEVIKVRKDAARPTSPAEHLWFALRVEGINLEIIRQSFSALGRDAILSAINRRPTGAISRRIGYLYETLIKDELPLPARPRATYINLLPEERYLTAAPRSNRRWLINDNLPGNADFCPLVRRTNAVTKALSLSIRQRIEEETSEYSPRVIQRAISYLYLKETKSSFEIEHEKPGPERIQRFAALLRQAGRVPALTEASLAAMQRSLVDRQFAAHGYRTIQNYVGEILGGHRERVDYIPPRPDQVQSLMDGLLRFITDTEGRLPSIIRAAVASFGFVLIHPFDDGNGRLHRFLIHHLLSKDETFPQDSIVPVSARMLADRSRYDACLETFSVPLMSVADYRLDSTGGLSMLNDLTDAYRFFDATPFVEYLTEVMEQAIKVDLREELRFMAGYEQSVPEIQAVADMPDSDINLLIRLTMQNGGALYKSKRRLFPRLTDPEISEIEEIIRRRLIFSDDNEQRFPLEVSTKQGQEPNIRRHRETMDYF